MKRPTVSDLITIKAKRISDIVFQSCIININNFRLVGGNKEVGTLAVNKCNFVESEARYFSIKPKVLIEKENYFSNRFHEK